MGWLLTSANLGDSRAILDTGVECVGLTGALESVVLPQGGRRWAARLGCCISPDAWWGVHLAGLLLLLLANLF